MRLPRWVEHSVRIARVELTRNRRRRSRSTAVRAVLAVGVVGLVVGSGVGAYTVGTALRRGEPALTVGAMQGAVTVGVPAVLVGLVQQTSRLRERMHTEHLLRTVAAFEIVLGVVFAVVGRTATRVSPAAASVAIGFAVGVGSVTSAVSIIVAVAGLVALTACLAVALSFAVELVTTRSPRFRRYRNALVGLGFVLGFLAWAALDAGVVSSGVLGELGGVVPTAWFVDLALVGVPGYARWPSGLGALALVGGGVPLAMVATTALATRVWEAEPVSAAALHRSRSLVGEGVGERVFGGIVSRPVLTVARKRWLQERRVPRALLMAGYLLLLLPVVWLPMLVASEVLVVSPVLLGFVLAVGSGLAFGLHPIGAEYASFPVTLTTTSGTTFVRGIVFSGIVIGGPVTAAAVLATALVSPLGALEAVLVSVTGVVVSVCALTVAVAVGMDVSYRSLVRAPVPLVNTPMYTELGRGSFLRMGVLMGVVGGVCLPAVCGYLPVVFEPAARLLGVSATVVRVGALAVTGGVAAIVSTAAYRRAVRSFNTYTLA